MKNPLVVAGILGGIFAATGIFAAIAAVLVYKKEQAEKKAEEKTEAEKQKPVSAVDPKAPFNQTKQMTKQKFIF